MNEKWTTDIPYIWTAEGWLYLAAVLDPYSPRIVEWSTADHMETSLCLEALSTALKSRANVRGVIHHSDRWPSALQRTKLFERPLDT